MTPQTAVPSTPPSVLPSATPSVQTPTTVEEASSDPTLKRKRQLKKKLKQARELREHFSAHPEERPDMDQQRKMDSIDVLIYELENLGCDE